MFEIFYQNTFTPTHTDQDASATLGGLYFAPQMQGSTPTGETNVPLAQVTMPRLDGQTALHEFLQTSDSLQSGLSGELHFRFNDSVLFGVIALDEEKFSGDATSTPLQAASKAAYEQIFSLLETQKFPYVLRFWNYMADINGITDGLERYRQFNLGRQQAFSTKEKNVIGDVPAACALGTASGPLTIAFLAARTPSLAIENPRQVSAYDYPVQYGPRSPLFSRASVVSIANTHMLLLSGTASIVGHQTRHADDVGAQTEESIANIAAVLEAAKEKTSIKFELADLHYIVYIRDPAHFSIVRDILMRRIGSAVQACYLQADICRSDLLVEIEGSASSR